MVRKQLETKPVFLTRRITSEHKSHAKRNIGSFLDDWTSKGKSFTAPVTMLPEFIKFLGRKHPDFKGIKSSMLSITDSTTRAIYDILFRCLREQSARESLKPLKKQPSEGLQIIDHEDTWQNKHPDVEPKPHAVTAKVEDEIVEKVDDHQSQGHPESLQKEKSVSSEVASEQSSDLTPYEPSVYGSNKFQKLKRQIVAQLDVIDEEDLGWISISYTSRNEHLQISWGNKEVPK